MLMEKTLIQDEMEETGKIPELVSRSGNIIEVRILDSQTIGYQSINDTVLYDPPSNSFAHFRHLRFSGNTPRNTGYVINIYQVLDENHKLLNDIGIGMIFLFLSLLIVSITVNYLVSKKTMRPFFNAIDEAARFDVLSNQPLILPDTSIDEFKRLNRIISSMTKKMRQDYLNLKEYNENSSHEIQTPLAVIRSKLDILMQSKNLSSENIDLIKAIHEATSRLFKLNQGLLLVSRIENLQFPETDEISFRELIGNCLANYEEILQLKEIKVERELSDPGMVRMNSTLADVLISNLLSNAVRYNTDRGFIRCRLERNILIIENSGPPLEIDPAQLFKRFAGGKRNPNSVGLGLSIVKKIADHYNMKIEYKCSGTDHTIRLEFSGLQIL
jgi:signal transduction histidine kinase